MDEAELRRNLEAGFRKASISDWQEKAPSMYLPDHEYLALREAKWRQRPADYRNSHPFNPTRILSRRERKRTKTLKRIDQSVREFVDDLLPIIIENQALIGATEPPTSLDTLIAQSTYWARHWVKTFRQEYEEGLAEGCSPEELSFLTLMLRDYEEDLADVEVLRRDPTRERYDWAFDRLIARHRATVEAQQSK